MIAAEGTAAERTRAWHLPGPGTATGDDRPDPVDERQRAREPATAAVAPRALRPLWVRVLTGASFAWRIRALRRRVARRRRRLARAALQWLRFHPQVRVPLEQGRPLAALRAARRDTAAPAAVRWPRVPLPVSRCGTDPAHPLVRYLAEPAGPTGAPVVVVGPHCAHTPSEHAGAAVVGIGVAPPGARVVVGGREPAAGAQWLPEVVDPAVHNSRGFNQRRSSGDIRLSGRQLYEQFRGQFHGLHSARSVTCAVEPDIEDRYAAANGIVALAAHGAPLIAGGLPGSVACIVGDELVTALASVTVADLRDDRVRELHSVRLRRAAVRAHGPAARWHQIVSAAGIPRPTLPSMSVLMASKRPHHVLEAARQVAAQHCDSPQLVVGLHGMQLPSRIERQLRERYPGEMIVRSFDDSMNLGEVLDALTRVADGDLISKWDDDDWYDAEHLNDMRWALQYSGGTMVGKAAEFVYLEQLDISIRRLAYGAETFSITLAGGTLTMARADLLAVGGWPSAVGQADRRLIARLQEHGARVYRTHGFGYVLRRAGGGPQEHTWRIGDDYFLLAATDQRPGLDLGFAGFGPGAGEAGDQAATAPPARTR